MPPWDDVVMADRRETFERLLAVWSGEADLGELDLLVSPTYCGHLGSGERGPAQLKQDIAAYRKRVPDVRFRVEHQFGEGDYLASRLIAEAPTSGSVTSICGINISRWENGLLAEEWAVWETFGATG